MFQRQTSRACFVVFGLAVLASACGAETDGGGGSGNNGGGNNSGSGGFKIEFPDGRGGNNGGGNNSGNPEGNCGQLMAIVRDFKAEHPDFEKPMSEYKDGLTQGLVKPQLDGDKKPQFNQNIGNVLTDEASFKQWYRDVAGVNMRVEVPLNLTPDSAGRYVFEDNDFFPVDGKGFGNEGLEHNFHFTTEIRGGFTYKGGEKFTFKGDDDVWVFVNGRLALDIGGIHRVEQATIDFDASAASLGITRGKTYSLDVFHAERHTVLSNFRVETTIDCLTVPVL